MTPSYRKSRAVIAICLLAGTKSVPRERIIELLWGDRAEAQARASLRQALYQLRDLHAGGSPLIAADRETLTLDRERVETDLQALRRAISSEPASLAASRVAQMGSFLTDLSGLTSEFDDWLRPHRARQEEMLRSAALDAAQQWIGTDPDAALSIASDLARRDPLDELAARIAIGACAAKDDPDRARHVYSRLAEALRDELQVEPAAETTAAFNATQAAHPPTKPAFAKTTQAGAVLPAAGADPAPLQRRLFSGKLARPRVLLASAGAAALVAALGTGAGYWALSGKQTGKTLVVEPLTVAAQDRTAAALSNGLSNDFASYLPGPDSNLQVVAGDTHRRNSGFLRLGGTASTANGILHASVRLMGKGDDTVLWSRSFESDAADAGSLRRQIAFWVSGVADCAVGKNEGAPAKVERETFRLFLTACDDVMNGNPSFLTPLRKVTEIAPDFAGGWYWYGQMQAIVGQYLGIENLSRKSLLSARKAQTLDPDNPAPAAIVALTRTAMAQWLEREELLARADRAPARFRGMAEYLHMVQMNAVGRTQEALAYAQRTLDVDRWDPPSYINLAYGWASSGYLTDALPVLDRISAVEPDEPTTKAARITILAAVGNAREALRLLEANRGGQLFKPIEQQAIVALAEARLDPAKANRSLETFRHLAETATPEEKLVLLQDMVIIGRIDAAYTLANALPQFPISHQAAWYSNFMAPFRADRRFPHLIEQQGTPAIWRKTGILPDYCKQEQLDYDCREAFSLPATTGT